MKRTKFPINPNISEVMKKGESTLQDTDIMPFGIYHDKQVMMANVPAWYLLKLFDSGKCFGAIKNYIADNETILRTENQKENDAWRKTVNVNRNDS